MHEGLVLHNQWAAQSNGVGEIADLVHVLGTALGQVGMKEREGQEGTDSLCPFSTQGAFCVGHPIMKTALMKFANNHAT